MPAKNRSEYHTSPEIYGRDFDLWQAELDELPALRKRLGRTALEGVRSDGRHNHDPLAHVWQLAEAGQLTSELMTKFKTEFVPDMGERSPDSGFYHVFSMQLVGNDIVSATGLSMRRSMSESVLATENDVLLDARRQYGLEREVVQQAQLDQIVKWASDPTSERYYGFASLCPPSDEVPSDVAKANGFKPERLMASIWIYEKGSEGLKMHALSLDHCTLERLQRLLDSCGVRHIVAPTTIAELGNELRFDGVDIQQLREAWSEILSADGLDITSMQSEANHLVESRPEAFKLYMKLLVDVTASLNRGFVNKNLSHLLRHARQSAGSDNAPALSLRRFRRFGIDDARALMDFARSRMIPHYIYGIEQANNTYDTELDVLSASGASASRVESYDGACPSSNYESEASELSAMSASGILNRQLVVDALMKEKRKGDCLTCGAVQTSVYGCGLCSKCNKVWCDEYRNSGRGLEISEIAKRVGKKKGPKKSSSKKS